MRRSATLLIAACATAGGWMVAGHTTAHAAPTCPLPASGNTVKGSPVHGHAHFEDSARNCVDFEGTGGVASFEDSSLNQFFFLGRNDVAHSEDSSHNLVTFKGNNQIGHFEDSSFDTITFGAGATGSVLHANDASHDFLVVNGANDVVDLLASNMGSALHPVTITGSGDVIDLEPGFAPTGAFIISDSNEKIVCSGAGIHAACSS